MLKVTVEENVLMNYLKLHTWKVACLALIVVLAVSVAVWKPWQPNIKANERTIAVSGDATIQADPDEFIFSPNYEFTNADKQAALADMSKKSDEIVAKLKALGVPNNKIQTNSANYGGVYISEPSSNSTYNLSLTITVDSLPLAQKVQDYLVSTSPSGAISPNATFSTAKEKQLESQARDKAEKDARAKADQSAKNLGFKIDRVKSVDDSGGFGGSGCVGGLCSGALSLNSATAQDAKLSVQPGQNDFPYSIKVTYYIH